MLDGGIVLVGVMVEEEFSEVGTGEGRLRIVRIKPSGGRLMGWKDFVNGYRLKPGDRFVSPT